MKKVFAMLVLLVCFHPSSALAKLAPVSLEYLIAESDLIIQAGVQELYAGNRGTRSAVLLKTNILKGQLQSDTITIEFSNEVHEQRIDKIGEYLLFLKKTEDGKYTGTGYGRSYWPLLPVFGAEHELDWVTPYVYPITMVIVPKTLVKETEISVPELQLQETNVKVIYYKDIMNIITALLDQKVSKDIPSN